jgi:hypothetical protein
MAGNQKNQDFFSSGGGGQRSISAKRKKMNIERPTSNAEWENLNYILQEAEELIKIFVTSIKTAEKKQK